MTISDAYRRCFELFARRDYEGCARESMPLIDQTKTHELLQVLLISLYRSGQSAVAEDLAHAIEEATAHDRWTNALLRLTLGRTGPAEVMGLIGDARRRCQACYYIGANQLTHSYDEAAVQAFDASIATGVRCTEADLARLERRAPGGSTAAGRGGMTEQQFEWSGQQLATARDAMRKGRPGEALEIASQLLEWACRVLDEDGVGMAAALQQIATIHFFARDYSTARPMFDEARDLYLENLGARNRAHVECLQQLAAAEVGSGCSAARVSELIQERRRLLELVVMVGPEASWGHR